MLLYTCDEHFKKNRYDTNSTKYTYFIHLFFKEKIDLLKQEIVENAKATFCFILIFPILLLLRILLTSFSFYFFHLLFFFFLAHAFYYIFFSSFINPYFSQSYFLVDMVFLFAFLLSTLVFQLSLILFMLFPFSLFFPDSHHQHCLWSSPKLTRLKHRLPGGSGVC